MRKTKGALQRNQRRQRGNSDHSVAEYHPRRVARMVSLTGRERLRALWYLLRFEISDYHYASRRMIELQLGLPPPLSHQDQAMPGRKDSPVTVETPET
jgi:hypothetical protein